MGKGRKQVLGRDLKKRLAACLLLSFTFAVFLVAEATKPKAPPAAAAMPAPPMKAPEPSAEPKPSEWHLGLSANLQLVTVNLTTRTTQAGFSPGLAFGAMWQPPWWTLSDSFLGIDALVDAKFVDLNNDATFDYFRDRRPPHRDADRDGHRGDRSQLQPRAEYDIEGYHRIHLHLRPLHPRGLGERAARSDRRRAWNPDIGLPSRAPSSARPSSSPVPSLDAGTWNQSASAWSSAARPSGTAGNTISAGASTADYLSEGTPAPITIENNGTAPLEVSSFSLSPEDPICFSFDPKDVLGTIGAQQSVSASMNFLPLSAEQQSCVLTIGNNTKSDSRYVINFTGTGVTKEVTGVNASSGSGSVILTWKDPEYNGFRKVSIQWAEDGGALSDPPATVLPGVGTFTASPLQNDHQYEFEIKTVDAQGAVSSGYSTRVQGSPTASTGLANVTILSADAQDRSTTISWSEPASSPTFAGVEISYQGVGSPQQAVKGTTSKTIYGLVNGTTYSFCLKSLYGAAGTSSGTTVDVTPRDWVPCHNVGNLAAWRTQAARANPVSWTDPTDYDFYSRRGVLEDKHDEVHLRGREGSSAMRPHRAQQNHPIHVHRPHQGYERELFGLALYEAALALLIPFPP